MNAKSEPPFALNPDLDLEELTRTYARDGRVFVGHFLNEPSARALLNALSTRNDWALVVNAGSKVYELDSTAQAALSLAQWKELEHRVADASRTGFQFRYCTIRTSDGVEQRDEKTDMLCKFVDFLNSAKTLDFFRTVTGESSVAFADGQATAYRLGDFLTEHDDGVAGKFRLAAYVLSLTEIWNPDWGGILQFCKDGNNTIDRIPEFNMLNLFRVPQLHRVSRVTESAEATRYSVTGWLRARP